MNNQEAIETLKANYPDTCYEQLREAVDMAISALQAQDVHDANVGDMISRHVAIDAFYKHPNINWTTLDVLTKINALPSAQPEPLSDAFTKAVWIWLLDYQIKVAELNGKYSPYEVLSWVVNDWRKEHE